MNGNQEKEKQRGKTKILHQNLVAYSFLAPSLIGVICFSLIPLVISLYVSLTDWNFTQGIGNWNFVGLTNFKNLWTDEWFTASLKILCSSPLSPFQSDCSLQS